MWFTTDAGICRYDGSTFTTYTPQDGLSDNEIFQLAEDSQNRMWYLPYNGHIGYYQNGTFYTSATDSTLKGLDTEDIYTNILEDAKKRIWLNSIFKGVYIRNPDGTSIHLKFEKLTFYIWKAGNEIMALAADGIYHFDFNSPRNYTFTSIPGLHIDTDAGRKIYHDASSGTLICPQYQGIFLINYKNNTVQKIFPELRALGTLPTKRSEKWIYHTNGAFLWNGKDSTIAKPEFEGAVIAHAVKDNEGGYWFATLNKGVLYVPSLEAKHLRLEYESNNQIRRIIQTKNKTLLAVREKCDYLVISSKNYTYTSFKSPIPSDNVRVDELTTDGDTIWITGKAIGLLKHYNNHHEVYFPRLTIKSISIDNDEMLASPGFAGLFHFSKHELTVESDEYKRKNIFANQGKRLYAGRITCHAKATNNQVLLGTNRGLAVYENGNIRYLSSTHPYLQNRIVQIKQDQKGFFWIVVDATGVVILNKNLELVGSLDEAKGIQDGPCHRLFIDETNEVWMITRHSVYRAGIKDNNINFEKFFLLESETINDITVDSEKVWIASSSGIVTLDRNHKRQNEVQTRITSVYINGEKVSLSSETILSVPYHQNNVRIFFTTVSFFAGNIQYRYKTDDNKSSQWTVTKSKEIEFSSLSPGEYHFQIQVQNSNGTWNKSTSHFKLIIKPPLWQQWWFITLWVSVTLLLLAFTAQRIYRENYKKLILHDKLVESELKALLAQMNPHFIFNTLNTIQRFFLTSDTKTANRLLSRFSSLMRRILDNTSVSFISLEDEIAFLNNYLEIEQIRFNHKFDYTIEIKGVADGSTTMIPSMTIQPFVENAILHGLMPKGESGHLKLFFRKDLNQVYVIVEDNGVGRKTQLHRTHTPRGINLIQERLAILNSKNKTNYRIKITDLTGDAKGTRVELYL